MAASQGLRSEPEQPRYRPSLFWPWLLLVFCVPTLAWAVALFVDEPPYALNQERLCAWANCATFTIAFTVSLRAVVKGRMWALIPTLVAGQGIIVWLILLLLYMDIH
jgi:hypothetical protein